MNWHDRYLRQATWTRTLRSYILERSGFRQARRVLEVGCGTGAVLADLPETAAVICGLDLSGTSLLQCRKHAPLALLTSGNALALPYASACFEITFCHFLLLWVADPLQSLKEMKRVTMPSGFVIAFAEPDYTAREDQPPELAWLGQQQNEALQGQGAALSRGVELAGLFHQAGIRVLEGGAIQASPARTLSADDWDSEWQALRADLGSLLPSTELESLQRLDRKAMLRGQRVLHVPTYFVWGQV